MGLTEFGSASSRNRSRSCRDDVACGEWREFMKEVCNLRRGWAGGSASLSLPARGFLEFGNDRLDRCLFGRTPSMSHHLPSLGRLRRAGGQVVHRLPGRHSSVAASPLRCRTGLSVGHRGSGRSPPGVLRWSFARKHRLVGTATPLRGYRRPGPVRASAHLSRVLVGAGVTPAVHSHGPASLAPVVMALIVRLRTVR